MKWIIVDLDGTLCDCSHRIHLRQAKQYEEFNAGIADDKPNEDVVTFVQMFNQWGTICHYQFMLCTGRDEKHRHATIRWLMERDLWSNFDELLMRPNDDYSPDAVVKLKLVDEFFGDRQKALDNVFLVLDDRDGVVAAFRDAGFKCWQVAAGSY